MRTERVTVHVTPGVGKERVEQDEMSGILQVWVKAKPEAGKANLAVCALLAKHFGVAAGDVIIKLGKTSREKVVEIRYGE